MKTFIMIISFTMFLGLANQTFAQYLSNGSFEIHRVGQYPIGHTGNGKYNEGQLMKCINMCFYDQYPNILFPPSTCFKENGWYSPTTASPDYYHVLGEYDNFNEKDASIPANRSWGRFYQHIRNPFDPDDEDIYTNLYDTLYPHNYNFFIEQFLDSAYAGFGIKLRNNDGNINQVAYKEYIQIKLSQPLTWGTYKVSYKVSKSKYSFKFSSICALFSFNSIIAPIPNPTLGEDNWETNLAWYFHKPFNYIFINKTQENAVCSNEKLEKTTGFDFSDNWQLIEDKLFVPNGTIYNYLTIGNFQTDDELFQELKSNGVNFINDWQLEPYFYYFIDDIIIEPISYPGTNCECKSSFFKFEIEKNQTKTDSNLCCYDYSYQIPDGAFSPAPLCPISKLQIKMDGESIWEEVADVAPYTFEPGEYNGTICIDKFSTEDNKTFTLLMYSRDPETNEYVLLSQCSRDIKLNCMCSCSDMEEYPYPPLKPSVYLKKVNSQSNQNCCWDIVLNNPFDLNSSSCDFDLSNKIITMHTNPYDAYYTFSSSNGFSYSTDPLNNDFKYFQAPSVFILKPGEEIIIGTICSQGNTKDHELWLNLNIGNSLLQGDTCSHLISQTLKCDSLITNCCDMISFEYNQPINSPFYLGCQDFDGDFNPSSFCCIPIIMKFKQTPDSCFVHDTLRIVIYDQNNQNAILHSEYIDYSQLLFSTKLLTWLKIQSGTSRSICIEVKNINTQDVCLFCDTLTCPIFNTHGKSEEEIELFKRNQEITTKDKDLILYPNPASDEIELKINFDKSQASKIQLFDNTMKEVFSNEYNFIKGENLIKIPARNLSSGVYYLNAKINEKIVTQKIIIIK